MIRVLMLSIQEGLVSEHYVSNYQMTHQISDILKCLPIPLLAAAFHPDLREGNSVGPTQWQRSSRILGHSLLNSFSLFHFANLF